MSTVIRNGVNLNRASTPTSWGRGLGIVRREPVRTSVRGAVVKAVSPAKQGPSAARRSVTSVPTLPRNGIEVLAVTPLAVSLRRRAFLSGEL